MKCAWQELLSVLPPGLRSEVNAVGQDLLQEIRLRLGQPPELIGVHGGGRRSADVSQQDLQFVINSASKYSPWLASTMSQGYLTAAGGHRIGVCGEAVMKDGHMTGIRNLSSVCIRVARDLNGLACDPRLITGSVLIIGTPGSGKTTFLRDLIRFRSDTGPGSIAVVDERGEIFPYGSKFQTGQRTDVLIGCGKKEGLEAVLRTMGPSAVAVDEITSEDDCRGLLYTAWCGVSLIATAHAASKNDLCRREVYKPLMQMKIFDMLVILQQDKSWKAERMEYTC